MGGASTGLSRLVPTHIGPARFVPTVYPRRATQSVDASVARARSTSTIRKHRRHHHSTRRGQASTSARLQSAAQVCWVDPTLIRSTRMERGTAAGGRTWSPSAPMTNNGWMTTTWKLMTAPNATSAWSPYIPTSWRRADTAATPTSCLIVACATLTKARKLDTTSTTTTSSASAPTVNETCLRLTASCRQDPPVRPRLLAGDATRRRRDAPSGRASPGLPSPTTSLCATLTST